MNLEEVKKRAVRGIIALTGRTVVLQVVNLVAFFLLGIFLNPAAIGVYIIVSALTRIFNLFTDLGFGAALIQKEKDPDQTDLATVFTIQEALVVVAIAIGLIATPVVQRWAGLDAQGVWLYYALLASLFFSSLKSIPSILMERKLAFDRQIIPQIVEALTFNLVVVLLAWKGAGVGSYSGAVFLSALIGVPIYFWLSPWKISFTISLERARSLLSYGVKFQGKSFLAVIKDDLLTFFLSGLVGPAGIGYWGWAQRWAYSPFRLVVDSVTKVTFPAYSRLQSDADNLKDSLEQSIFTVSTILFPVLVLMGMLIRPIIDLVPRYEKWLVALPSFYFLLAVVAISAISNILINFLDATGRVGTTLKLMVLWIVLTWLATILFVAGFGYTGIAMASFVVSLSIWVTVIIVRRIMPFSLVSNVAPAIAGSLTMGAGMWVVNALLPNGWWRIASGGFFGAIIYGGVILILARDKFVKWQKYLSL